MVSKNGKTFQQTFWVNPNADSNSDAYKANKLTQFLNGKNRRSGTTAQVALQLQRNFIGFELNPEYI